MPRSQITDLQAGQLAIPVAAAAIFVSRGVNLGVML